MTKLGHKKAKQIPSREAKINATETLNNMGYSVYFRVFTLRSENERSNKVSYNFITS